MRFWGVQRVLREDGPRAVSNSATRNHEGDALERPWSSRARFSEAGSPQQVVVG